MRVPFLDLPLHNRAIWSELRGALDDTIAEARFILGPDVERFESHFAQYVGTRHCVGLNNGTSALHMALLACGVGPGDEVITTPLTWISTSWAISYVGATPVYVDVDPITYTLDAGRVERAITPRTRAILPVHLYGQAADVPRLGRLAEAHRLFLIEDVAQAQGARHSGRRLGSFGRVSCFSFYPGKNLGAFGEAGAITTDDDEVAARVRWLRDHAQKSRHHHVEVGYNTRMEGIQGAVLDVKLRYLDGWNAVRVARARQYGERLEGVPHLVTPSTPTDPAAHVWHLYVVLVEAGRRDALRAALEERGIATALHYPVPVPFQPAYAHLGYRPGDLPVAEDVASRCLSLPMYPELSEDQVAYTSDALRSILPRL